MIRTYPFLVGVTGGLGSVVFPDLGDRRVRVHLTDHRVDGRDERDELRGSDHCGAPVVWAEPILTA